MATLHYTTLHYTPPYLPLPTLHLPTLPNTNEFPLSNYHFPTLLASSAKANLHAWLDMAFLLAWYGMLRYAY